MSFVVLLLTAFNCWSVDLQNIPNYYGSHFIEKYSAGQLKNEELKSELFQILSGGHLKNGNSPDELIPSCTNQELRYSEIDNSQLYPQNPEAVVNKKCEQHISLGYEGARKKLFGAIHLGKNSSGNYFVKDVYCERDFTDADFGGDLTFGPGLLPKSGNIINTEHTWPQSRFTGRFPREMQKSDLHHLFPTDSEMNSRRGSLRFGYVVEKVEELKCPQNRLGRQQQGDIIFEVPDSQKGNTARAIFYFAIRYQMKLSPPEEAALRKWTEVDPVDESERLRNDQVEQAQGNRNPFVDMPDLIQSINQFQ